MRGRSLALCAALLAVAAPAVAQGPAPDAQAAARARGEEGLKLFQAGKWDEAFSAFERADGLFHAPTLVVLMAGCRRNQGRLVEAKALYEKVASEPLPRDPPEAFKKAQATARTEIEGLRGRIPFLRVTVTGPGAEQAQVSVDGKPLAAAELLSGASIDPGEHQLSAEAPRASGRLRVTLKEGEPSRVTLALEPEKPPAVAVVVAPRGGLLPAGIAFGVGGAGLLVGAVTGGLALGKVGASHVGCVEGADGVWHCPSSSQASATAAASSARTLTAAAATGFALGGAGLVTGVVLAILRPGGAPEKAAFQLDVGPLSIGARGRF